MSVKDLDEITSLLQKATFERSGVSFAGKSLKLDSEDDAKEVIDAINTCTDLQYLNLEGNTLGVDAAKAIAKGLEGHSELKHALWKDLFTGRMKTEIPKALKYLSVGLMLADAHLTELDLSDNAFGPIGIEGLAALLMSQTCYSLEILKLENNGLGITGGKMLAKGLLECYQNSKEKGKPLALKVFIAGRNRLENDGAKALAEVFKALGSLEQLSMPQNGIYAPGITALCSALSYNTNLQVLNLNDNTITAKGAVAVAKALESLQNLREINLGDCLLKTKGSVLIANALQSGHPLLEELNLGFNEIRSNGGIALVDAISNKQNLQKLHLNGNQFGELGREKLSSKLKASGQFTALSGLSDDEEEDEEEDESDEDDDEEEGEGDEEEEEVEDESIVINDNDLQKSFDSNTSDEIKTKIQRFLEQPTPENFAIVGEKPDEAFIRYLQTFHSKRNIEPAMQVLMKISSLSNCSNESVRKGALNCSFALYKEVFQWCKEIENLSDLNNSLLVHLGLIKSEDKKMNLNWNLEGCFLALNEALQQDCFPQSTKDTLLVFLGRPNTKLELYGSTKLKLIKTLSPNGL